MGSQINIPDSVAINFFKNNLKGEPTGDVYFARCPVCGDSATHHHKKRMYLLKKNDLWMVFCHNCAYSASLLKFIKDFYPLNYDRVISDSLGDFFFKKDSKQDKLNDLVSSLSLKVEKRIKKERNPVKKFLDNHCIKLGAPTKNIKHRETMVNEIFQLKKRLLPDEFIDSLYFCLGGKEDKYKFRVLIPFYDKQNEPYYFQAKATQKYQLSNKYINWDEEDKKPLYNEHHVNKNSTVYVTEGLLDSLFIKNSVASMGTSLSRTRIKEIKKYFPKRAWIMDNDKSGFKIINRLFEMGEDCFIMPKKYAQVKDLNDLAILLKKRDLTQIIEENTYNSLEGLVELSRRENGIYRKKQKWKQV
jgi:hypothetical protein